MAITYQQAASNTFSASRSPSVTYSTAPAAGDILIWFIAGGTDFSPTVPSGWENPLGGNTNEYSGQNTAMMIAHRVTSGEAAGSTVTWTLTNFFATTETGNVTSVVLRGATATGTIFDTAAAGSNGGNVSPFVLPQVTPTVNGGMIVAGVGKDTTGSYTGAPTGWTIRSTDAFTCAAALLTYDTATLAATAVGPTNITPSGLDQYAAISAVVLPELEIHDTAGTVTITVTPAGTGAKTTATAGAIAMQLTPNDEAAKIAQVLAAVAAELDLTATTSTDRDTAGTISLDTVIAATATKSAEAAAALTLALDLAGDPVKLAQVAGTLDLTLTLPGTAVGHADDSTFGALVLAIAIVATAAKTTDTTGTTTLTTSITADTTKTTAPAGNIPLTIATTATGTKHAAAAGTLALVTTITATVSAAFAAIITGAARTIIDRTPARSVIDRTTARTILEVTS